MSFVKIVTFLLNKTKRYIQSSAQSINLCCPEILMKQYRYSSFPIWLKFIWKTYGNFSFSKSTMAIYTSTMSI